MTVVYFFFKTDDFFYYTVRLFALGGDNFFHSVDQTSGVHTAENFGFIGVAFFDEAEDFSVHTDRLFIIFLLVVWV